MKKIWVEQLCLEVTRRCNMGCAHCLRGDAQDVDISHAIIDEIFNQVDGIGQVTFTGGEPSLNVSAIRYFFQRAERAGKMPASFFVATNGKANQEKLAVELLRQYPKMEERELCGVALSIDEWHDPQEYGNSILKGLSFYSNIKEFPEGYNLVPDGRAVNLHLDSKRIRSLRSSHIIVSEDSDFDSGEISVELLYVAANGNIVGDCDMSYKRIDAESTYQLHDFRWEIEKMLAEQAE